MRERDVMGVVSISPVKSLRSAKDSACIFSIQLLDSCPCPWCNTKTLHHSIGFAVRIARTSRVKSAQHAQYASRRITNCACNLGIALCSSHFGEQNTHVTGLSYIQNQVSWAEKKAMWPLWLVSHFESFVEIMQSAYTRHHLQRIYVALSEISHFAGLPRGGDIRPSALRPFYKNFPSRTFALPFVLTINLAHSQQSWLQHSEDQLQKVCLSLRQSI